MWPKLHDSARIRCRGRRIEGRVFYVVAHQPDLFLAEGFYVEQRAAMAEPELPVVRPVEAKLKIHELRRRPDVELQVLEDGFDIVAFKAKRPLHALGVDRARPHPLVDGELRLVFGAESLEHQRDSDAVVEMAGEQVFAQLLALLGGVAVRTSCACSPIRSESR